MPETSEQQVPEQQMSFAEIHAKIDASIKFLETIADDPEKHKEAAHDTLVSDVLPSVRWLSGATGNFVKETVEYVNELSKHVSALEQAMQAMQAREQEGGGEEDGDEEEEEGGSVLDPDDATSLKEYVLATMGLISKKVPKSPETDAIIARGKELLAFIEEATEAVEEEDTAQGA